MSKTKTGELTGNMLSLDDIIKRQNVITECLYYFNMGVSIERISSLVNVSRPSVYKIINSNLKYVSWCSRKTKDRFASIEDKSLSLDNITDDRDTSKERKGHIKELLESIGESGESNEW